MKNITILGILLASLFYPLFAEEMPYPTYDNSLILGMVFYIEAAPPYIAPDEINTIIDRFGRGLYAPLLFSRFVGVDMDWKANPETTDLSLQQFRDTVDLIIQKARFYKVGIHFILTYGLSRNTQFYNPAREEDIRNAQWYNDNNIVRENQLDPNQPVDENFNIFNRFNDYIDGETGENSSNSSVVNKYVFTTLSRYARKLRAHLEAKTTAAFAYLKQKQRENPNILFVISGPGEAELNYYGIDNTNSLQTYFCDYSPFAVLEFRDWIKHEGMYAPGEKYAGEGYPSSGDRYRGDSGLGNFNNEFGTGFTTWDLKYYNWDLRDPVDDNYQDNNNPDPHVIPADQFRFGEMLPQNGEKAIGGGFDPPRLMLPKGQDAFSDLWQTFRETMVYHYVKDIAVIAWKSGFPREHYYTHQIPADYVEGSRPDEFGSPGLNPRYYSSASPLWTARVYDDIGMGVSLYDLNYGDRYADTSQYVIPAISAMSTNWAAVEYNPEVIPANVFTPLSAVDHIYSKIMRLYQHNVHFVDFFKWSGDNQYQFSDTNRGLAARLFFDTVKDKARQSIDTRFTPAAVKGFTGNYRASARTIYLNWSQKIWADLDYNWSDWGDFKEFVIYRGYSGDFQCNADSEIARLTANMYEDAGFNQPEMVYYKIVAVNIAGEAGDPSVIKINTTSETRGPGLKISMHRLNFGAAVREGAIPAKTFIVGNTGVGILNWTAHTDEDWISVTPASGINSGVVTVMINGTFKTGGPYTGTITVAAPGAADSPQTISVNMVIYPTGADNGPFGALEFPLQDSTVPNTVPFTGWALDDIGVKSVKIYLQQESSRIFVGDAVLCEGVRPDIAAVYPTYPNNQKAGWTYILLTQNLPNQGNGVFTFQAVAVDGTWHQTVLGTRTITCANAGAALPFGTIDTPIPGGIISGNRYRSHGWVLTPLPNWMPEDGSTINIYIDGVFVGHPVYNIYRPDVAALLPGYTNSNRPHAYFDIDTETLKNGVHTIYWTARDSAGNTGNIGGRKFTVLNLGTGGQGPMDRNHESEGKKHYPRP
ncbi:MAG: BACON domain-containing protein [Candidatus Aminicenantes bacterium]|nr:BACON domain-containing protein [Candidatus Aminicenantes bacterium]